MLYLFLILVGVFALLLLFVRIEKNPSEQELRYRKFIEIKNRINLSLEDLGFKIEDWGKVNVYYAKRDKQVSYSTSIEYRYNYHKFTGHTYVDILKFEAYFKLKGVDINLSSQYFSSSKDTQIKKAFYDLQKEVNKLLN